MKRLPLWQLWSNWLITRHKQMKRTSLKAMIKLTDLLDRWRPLDKAHSLCPFPLQWHSCRCPQDTAPVAACQWDSKSQEDTVQRTRYRQGRRWSHRWRWACLLEILTCNSSQQSSCLTPGQVCDGMKQTQRDRPKSATISTHIVIHSEKAHSALGSWLPSGNEGAGLVSG